MNCKQCKCKLTKRNKLGFPLLVKLTIELESCYVSDLRSEFDIVKNEIVFEIHALMAKVQLMKNRKQRCHFHSIPFFDNLCCQSLHCNISFFILVHIKCDFWSRKNVVNPSGWSKNSSILRHKTIVPSSIFHSHPATSYFRIDRQEIT